MTESKYRWHDLRKNPDDLPTERGWVLCEYRNGELVFHELLIYTPKSMEKWAECELGFYKEWTDNREWMYGGNVDHKHGMVAWKYIEPYDETD